jgi:hypothetical protein
MVLSAQTIAVVAMWNVVASSAYYVRGAEYYLGSREPEGIWYTPRGDLGRRGAATVRPKEFARLYEGLGENGQALITNMGGKADRRVPAFDLTFSAPRSVSPAWAFADGDVRRNLEVAQERAARDGRAHYVRFRGIEAFADAPRAGGIVEVRRLGGPDDPRPTFIFASRSDIDLERQVTAPGAAWLD